MMKNTTSQCVGKIQSVHAGQNPALTTKKLNYDTNIVCIICFVYLYGKKKKITF